MTFTRNKNSQVTYNLEQDSNKACLDYTSYIHANKPKSFMNVHKLANSTQPTRSLNPSAMSKNPVDIESMLRGISANNMVNGSFNVKPMLKKPETFDIYERVPFINAELKDGDKYQRPYIGNI